ncbi:hypothetical protein [Noviherbaspirillum aerium]|uniref:hypothetical protein n=1 Tax=Noviherbaspirillum aerium TaxID=2588497 RepID=UPI00178C4E07|nr:hypothetical protein [Noviherbaspirillum aerium]
MDKRIGEGIGHFGDFQYEIYFKPLQGILRRLPVDFGNWRRTTAAMTPSVLNYVQR